MRYTESCAFTVSVIKITDLTCRQLMLFRASSHVMEIFHLVGEMTNIMFYSSTKLPQNIDSFVVVSEYRQMAGNIEKKLCQYYYR